MGTRPKQGSDHPRQPPQPPQRAPGDTPRQREKERENERKVGDDPAKEGPPVMPSNVRREKSGA